MCLFVSLIVTSLWFGERFEGITQSVFVCERSGGWGVCVLEDRLSPNHLLQFYTQHLVKRWLPDPSSYWRVCIAVCVVLSSGGDKCTPSPVRPGRSSGCRLRTGQRSDAAISTKLRKKINYPKTVAELNDKCRYCCLLVQDLPWTAAWGCRSQSLPEPNTASRRRRVWPGIERCEQKNRD